MGDEHDGTRELLERVLEHVDRVDVEVVGGLVEAEQRFGRHEHLGQRKARSLAAGEHAHVLVDVVAVEEEGAQEAALLGHGPLRGHRVDLLQHRIGLPHALELVLGVVSHAHVQAQLYGTRRGSLLAEQDLEQRGLARAVGAHERHAVAAIEREVHARVDGLVLEGLGDVGELCHHVSRARRLGEGEVHVLVALGQDDELALDLFDPAHALLGLRGLRGLVAKLVDEDLHVGDLALLGGTLGPHLLQVVLALLEVARVVAHVGGDAAVLDGGHVAHALVHEGAVVGDEQHGTRVAGDELLEPLDALEVEVVGGLVKKQQVGVLEQELGEGDAHLPAARELLGGLVEVGHGKAEAAEDGARPALELVATQVLEAVLRASVLVKQDVELRALGRGGDLGLKLVGHVAQALDLGGGGHDLFERRVVAGELGLLLEVAHGGVLGEAHRAGVGRLLPHDDLEEGGLAGTVGTHERPALTGVDLQGRLLIEGAGAKGLGYLVGEQNHACAPWQFGLGAAGVAWRTGRARAAPSATRGRR